MTVSRLHLILLATCIVLSAVLYFYGGATNPFVSLYLVPIAISAATLSIRFTSFLTVVCLAAYSLLLFYYQPLQVLSPHHEMVLNSADHSMHVANNPQISWHILGMWLNFGLSALLITWFVFRMAHTLRARDAELSAIREKQLRDEQLLGIATLAAGMLHELGTPLATITLLAEDMKSAAARDPELAQDATLLAEQVTRCKAILQNLARVAEQPSGQLQRVSLNEYLDTVLLHWQLLRPGIPLANNLQPSPLFIRADNTLEQALVNLLNNAADASPAGIAISTLDGDRHGNGSSRVSICIRDHGQGIGLAAEQLGKPFVTTRGQGRGLGLFLSNAAIERLGGEVTLAAHAQGGTVATVRLPAEL